MKVYISFIRIYVQDKISSFKFTRWSVFKKTSWSSSVSVYDSRIKYTGCTDLGQRVHTLLFLVHVNCKGVKLHWNIFSFTKFLIGNFNTLCSMCTLHIGFSFFTSFQKFIVCRKINNFVSLRIYSLLSDDLCMLYQERIHYLC